MTKTLYIISKLQTEQKFQLSNLIYTNKRQSKFSKF